MKIHRILQVTRKEGDRTHQIVLAMTSRGEFVTWDYYDDTKYSGGHYHMAFEDALEDFQKRIEEFAPMENTPPHIEYCARQIGQAEII